MGTDMIKNKILVVIPAYNEGKSIKRVIDNLKENYSNYDYVIVNDGSKDDTIKICKENHYNYIDLPVNLGLAGAFQTGLKYAYAMGYEYAIQYDGDGQHRAEYIKEMCIRDRFWGTHKRTGGWNHESGYTVKKFRHGDFPMPDV